MQTKNVFVTGGTGFIGANLIYRLIGKGFTIHLLVRKETNFWRLKKIQNKIHTHFVDPLELGALSSTLKKINPNAIFNLAAYGGSSSETDIQETIQANINITANLLLASQNIPYKIFVNTGSSSEYGFKKNAMNENDALSPSSFYAATKAGATYLCQVFSKQYKKPIVTLRPFSVYGPYESKNRFIPTIVQNLINKKDINVTKSPSRRDFIYIDDIIDAYIKTYQLGKKLGGEIFNLGTGKEYSNQEVIEQLFKVSKKKVAVNHGAYAERSWDTLHWKADISKAKKGLDWKPKYTLAQGLKKTFRWFSENSTLYEN